MKFDFNITLTSYEAFILRSALEDLSERYSKNSNGRATAKYILAELRSQLNKSRGDE